MIYLNSKGQIKKKYCKTVDFVFVYEVKNREIWGITLLGYELIKRGYSVGYVNTWHGLHHSDIKYDAKVAVVFEAYNTSVLRFALSFIEHCDNVLNMQWEQILADSCLTDDSIYVLRGDADKVYHVSWGEKNKKHLVERCHISEHRVKVVGNIGLDFVSKRFEGFFKSKDEICHEFGLEPSKGIVLFISSFGPPNVYESELAKVSIKSKKEILEWLERYADDNPDKYIIYRPHPTELFSEKDYKTTGKGNIKIIKNYSVQQWIVISDVILNWFSTSLADVYAAGKKCVFLRPYKMPDNEEYHMFRNIKMAKNYDEMIEQILDESDNISREEFEQYYCFDENKATFEKIADECEGLLNDDKGYVYDNFAKQKVKELPVILVMREYYGWFKSYIQKVLKRENSYDEIRYHMLMSNEHNVSEKRIIDMMKRISDFV